MLGVEGIDWVVIAVYLVGITAVGIWAMKKVKSAASFFIGDRKFGKWMMMFFMFGSGTHSDQAVGVAAKTYESGVSGIWYQWLWLFVTPFYWIAAPVFRRMRAVTTGDYFEIRYGTGMSVLFALMGMLQLMISIGMMLKGSSAMITAVSGGGIDPNIAIVAMTIMFVIYGVAGGMSAAIFTDLIQGVLTIALSFLILPFAMSEVGGMAGIREKITDGAMLEIVAPGEITVFFIAVVAFNALIGWVSQPHTMAVCAAGKSEMEGRIGVTVGMFLKRICTVAWMLTGLCAVAMYMGRDIEDIDQVYGLMAHDLLPKIGPGLIGLFIASMLASVMSSCDAFMVASSGLFTENIYKRLLAPDKSDKHYVFVGRTVSIVIVVLGIFFAFYLTSVVQGLEIFWKISAMMGIAFWVGLFWRRATTAGAWTGTLVSFAALLITSRVDLAGVLPGFMFWEGKLHMPWQMVIYLSSGFVSLVVVSLFTKRVPAERLDRLYECLRTPIGENEPEGAVFTLPEGVAAAERRVLIDHPDFEIPRLSFVGFVGFVGSWAAVGGLIGFVYWIMGG